MKRHQQRRQRWRFSPRTPKKIFVWGAALLVVFVIINLGLWSVYHSRTYPRTKVMNATVGSVAYGELSAKISRLQLLPENIVIGHGQQKAEVSLADLGISKDIQRTVQSANKQRSWLPIVNLFRSPELQAPITFDSQKLTAQSDRLGNMLRQAAVNARLKLEGTTVNIKAAQPGYELDKAQLQQAVSSGLDKAQTTINAPVTVVQPKITAASLKAKKTDLEAQLTTSLTFTFNSKSKKASPGDIAGWYTPDQAGGYSLAADKVEAYIAATATSFAIKPKNASQLAASTAQALAKHQVYSGAIEQQIALKTFTYCTAVRGVDASNLPALRAKAAESLASSKGWSVDGLVDFKEVSSGCDFTIWLTAADQMPSFGAICDPEWSCRIGSNVVINFVRWQNASPAWNAAGLSLDVYRNMAINHETGHWLGFEHSGCPGAGQPAPVMMQQSIDLQGCTFNAWPTTTEIATLRRTLGI